MIMETNAAIDFKGRLQSLIAYQDVLARNYLLAGRSCDQEFDAFLNFHNDLRRKYLDLRVSADQMDQSLEEYRIELARKDKKIQSQSSQILRLTQHNKRNHERLTELQRCLGQIQGTITGQNTFEQLRDILRDSVMSDSEATTDLSDKNCTGDELETDTPHMMQNIPKVVSQSNGIGTIKRAVRDESRPMGRIIGTTSDTQDGEHRSARVADDIPAKETKNEQRPVNTSSDPLCSSPYSNITVGRVQTSSTIPSRPSLLAHQRPKQKVRKPSKEFLNTKSEESELSTDDIFWSKQEDNPHRAELPTNLYPVLPKLASPLAEQKTLTPSTPVTTNLPFNSTPTGLTKISPSNIGTLRARAHNFISRNILIPEMCCVCLKRIHFGKLAYRCQACSALCHTGCKENCATLCLPSVKTPNRGAVSKFTPRESNQLQVPALLVHCIKEIEQRGLQEVGIYRLNVVESQVKELKERILKSRTGLFDLSHYQDIHLICGVVKDFLRSLSEPLLTNALWKSFATVIDEESDLIKQEKIDALLHQLPKPNRDTLAFVILHLQRVAVAPLCRMPVLNLSRTMGPAMIGYSSKHVSGIDIVGETYKQTKILEFFLKLPSEYWTKFLVEIPELPTCNSKPQIGTPILIRHQPYHQTPPTNHAAPCNTFFSPI